MEIMDVEADLTLPDCSTTTPVSDNVIKWTSLFAEGKLSPDMLREYWFEQIPVKCAVGPVDDAIAALDSLGSTSELITELEQFIYNSEKEVMNEYLRKFKNNPPLCAEPLKHGDLTYNCKECNTDASCVMCADCFQKSSHRCHKYRMAISAGGGFCDCGDPEAWKRDPFCESHMPSLAHDDCPKPQLPLDLYQRCKFIFYFVVKFSLEVINKKFISDMRSQLCSKDESSGKYLIVMYNGDCDVCYDEIIELLVKVTKCTPRKGLELALKINKEGRAVITSSDFRSCCEIKRKIDGSKSLEVHVLPFSVVAYQNFAHHVLNWVRNILKICVEFRSAIVEVFRNNACDNNVQCGVCGFNFLDRVLLQDLELWKSARMQWNLLLCSGMLMEYEYKQVLGIHFVKNYASIMKNYVIDYEYHQFSVASLSVQLFTVPSIAHTLIADHNAFKTVVDDFLLVKTPTSYENDMDPSRLLFMDERASLALHDVLYLLYSPPSTWTENLRTGFCSGMSSFLTWLRSLEGMNGLRRQLGTHTEFEPEWEEVFELLLKIYPIVNQLCEWCASDRTVLLDVYKMVATELKALYSTSMSSDILKSFGAYQVNCIRYEATIDSVTFHLPLTRFLGVLHLSVGNCDYGFNGDQLGFMEKPSPMLLIEQVVRTTTLISQFRAGMWRKNGDSLARQVVFYHKTKFRGMMLDMDITVLQIGASLIDSNTFLINLLYKFGILEWNDDELVTELPETDSNQLRILVEEFLYLIIVLTSERYQVGMGNVSQNECTKYEMTHLLSVKPMPHSELMKAISSKSKVITDVENVIQDVAVFRPEENLSRNGHYELKDGYPCFYNRYFFHFSREDMLKSEQTLKARHKNLYELECCPPPILPKFCEAFAKVRDLLKCDVLLRVIKMVLNTIISYGENSGYQGQLEKVLFLIGIALREEEMAGSQFGFTAQAKEREVDKLMVNIYCSPHGKDQKDLVKWLLVKYRDITNDSFIAEAITVHDSLKESDKEQKLTKSMLAESARANIMAKMKSMQETFASKNAKILASRYKNTSSEPEREVLHGTECPDFANDESRKCVTCMLCQEDEVIVVDGRPVILAVYVQLSTVLMRDRKIGKSALEEAETIYLSSNMGPSPYVSTCGHAMHAECLVSWRAESVRRKTYSAWLLHDSLDSSNDEYLCPLCQCISNSVLLISPAARPRNDPTDAQGSNTVPFAQWLKIAVTILRVTKYNQPKSDAVNNQGVPVAARETSSNKFSCSASIADPEDIKAFTFLLEDSETSDTNDTAEGCSSASSSRQQVITQKNSSYNVFSGEGGWVLNVKKYTEESFGSEILLNRNQLPRDGMHWINNMCDKIYGTFIGKKSCEATNWSPIHLWKTVAYTIHSIENNLRYSGRPLLGAFTIREEQCLGNLVYMAYSMGECNQARLQMNELCLKCLSYIVDNGSEQPSVLDWDSFGILIVLLVSVPNIIDINNSLKVISSMGRFLQRLLLISQIAQYLITMHLDKIEPSNNGGSTDTECLLFIAGLVCQNYSQFDTNAVWDTLKDELRPFLRCCIILQHFHAPKPGLCGLDELENDTYENLCSYLKLPISCKELLGDEVTQSLFATWAKHPFMNDPHSDRAVYPTTKMTKINELVDLPDDFSDLLNKARNFSCQNPNLDDSYIPTMCLVCGEILCGFSYCCQKELNRKKVGACTYHAHHCGGGAGLFLQIRECQLMMFAGLGRACFRPPPYLDEHGETDAGLIRGNQLCLFRKSYRKLQLVWSTHGVYEEVSKVIEKEGLDLNWESF